MQILITANKGGVGCSSIAYLIATIASGQLVTNDPWHVPDSKIFQIKELSDLDSLITTTPNNLIYDLSMLRNKNLAMSTAKKADLVLVPCTGNFQSILAAIATYRQIRTLKKRTMIVVNGYDNREHRLELLDYLQSKQVPPRHVITLRHSRLANRLLRDGPFWENNTCSAKGLHRLNRTLEIYNDILSKVIEK